jgi:hypothetical protein
VNESKKWSAWHVATAVAACAAGFVAFLAAVRPAFDLVSDGAMRATAPFRESKQPSQTEVLVTRFVSEARSKMAWERAPTVYGPSIETFREHFSALHPYRAHAMSLGGATMTDIPTMAQLGPAFAGRVLAVRARFDNANLIETDRAVGSWAFELSDPRIARTIVLCRVPMRRGELPKFVPGDKIVARGVVLADGAVSRLDGQGMVRVLYMTCSAVGSVTTIRMLVWPSTHRAAIGIRPPGVWRTLWRTLHSSHGA